MNRSKVLSVAQRHALVRRVIPRAAMSGLVVLTAGGLVATLLTVDGAVDPVSVVAAAVGATVLAYSFRRAPEATLISVWWGTLLASAAGLFFPSWVSRPLRLLDVAAAVVLSLCVALRIDKPAPSRRPLPRALVYSAIAFVAAGVLSAVSADVPPGTLVLGALGATKFLLLGYAGLMTPWSPEWKRKFLTSLHLSITLVAAVALVNIALPGLYRSFFAWSREGQERVGLLAAQSIFPHPSHLAMFASFAFAVTLAHYVRRPRASELAYVLAAAFCAVVSLRLKGLTAILVALAVVAVLEGGRFIRRFGAIGGVGLTAIALTNGSAIPSLARDQILRYTSTSDETIRQILYTTAADIAERKAPLGAGFGRYGSAEALRDYSPVYLEYGFHAIPGLAPSSAVATQDALWSSILGEAGWLGLLSLVALFAYLAWSHARVARIMRDSPWALAAAIYVVSLAVMSISSPGFAFGLSAVSLGILVSIGHHEAFDPVEGAEGPPASGKDRPSPIASGPRARVTRVERRESHGAGH